MKYCGYINPGWKHLKALKVVLWRKSQEQEVCVRRRMLFITFVPEIFTFLKYANYPSDDIIHSTKFSSNMMKKDICIRNVWFFAVRFYWMCSTIWACQFGYHGNILGTSYAWSSKYRNMLTQVCGLVQCFATWKSLTYWMKRVGTGKEQVAMGT